MIRIVVSDDFSDVPAGRYLNDGPFSGQKFREDHLKIALGEHDQVTVNLDGVEGFGSSFLEEAFGGLVREDHFSADELHRRLIIESDDPAYERQVWLYIDKAAQDSGQAQLIQSD